MNEPIISPMGAAISAATAVTSLDCYGGFGKALLSFTKKLICVALIVDVLAMVVPTRNEVVAMYVARCITPANIKATGEFADKAVDKLIEKIVKASKAMKE